VADRYTSLVAALYNGSAEEMIATEVTFEDGRRGTMAARVKIRDVPPLQETLARVKAA
jgi:long-chain acyl-CoA synthetase